MEDFFNKITKNKDSDEFGIQTYVALVFNAHYHFIKTTFALYFKETKEEDFSLYVEKYIKSNRTTKPFPNAMIVDFMYFVKEANLERRKFANDLLRLECKSMKIFDLPYDVSRKAFSWKKKYKIGINTTIIKQDYASHIKPQEFRKNYLLIYKDLDYDSSYIEITAFIYKLIVFRNNKSILQNLKYLCYTNKLDFKETKKALEDILEFYARNGILETSILYKDS